MNKCLVTPEFLEAHKNLTVPELAKLAGCSVRTIQRARQCMRTFVNTNKKEKREFQFTDMNMLAKQLHSIRDVTESKQHDVVYQYRGDQDWIALAVIGDLHFGSIEQDLDLILKHTQLILECPECIAIQLGDLVEAQASMTTRTSNREAPSELPQDLQREAVRHWVTMMKEKLVAIITGNHDMRAIRTEGYDIGEEVATIIEGAYLGYNGTLRIMMNHELSYKVYLSHYGKGYSMYNPVHPAVRLLHERPDLDVVAVGHRHEGVAVFDYPRKDGGRSILVRAAGYSIDSNHYGWYMGTEWHPPDTPVLLLNTHTRTILPFRSLEMGLQMLNILNQH